MNALELKALLAQFASLVALQTTDWQRLNDLKNNGKKGQDVLEYIIQTRRRRIIAIRERILESTQ